ncbi:MAG: hypothetical protein ACFCU8_06025 [Thermosynechococcaceae cyanobacterium]
MMISLFTQRTAISALAKPPGFGIWLLLVGIELRSLAHQLQGKIG